MDMEQEERAVTPRGIKNSNANGRDATLATPQLDGRQVIYSDVEAVTRSNVVQVLDDALMVHMGNRAEIEFLYNYVRGNQPILERVKDVRPEICNRIVINRANEIVVFKTASFLGEPLQYVSRGADQSVPQKIEKLNSMMISESKASKDMRLAYWMFTCGVGYRLVLRDKAEAYMADELYDEAPFEIYTLDPRNTFVIRRNDVTERVIAGVTFTFRDDYTVKYT
ncbi:phage portal protein, partial [uncultured Mailhella sp.]|uniref:phage portal protein n=1 Tax=uncultured Mailhella sp. TaxID=1981031 RepID=UPI00260B4003